jgi:hypothetical protein
VSAVRKALKKAKKSEAKDSNGISPSMLKYCGEAVLGPLTNAINSSISEGIVPDCWKEARVVPVFKKGSRSKMENYRPVAILNCCRKILEEIVRQQFEKHFQGMKLILEEQHGFRPGRSTSSAAHSAIYDIRRLRAEGKTVALLLFDLSAAFDMVDAEIMVAKIKIYGADEKTCSWLHSYMTGRWQMVQVGEETSSRTILMFGVPQGSGISPFLLGIFTACMPEICNEGKLLLYADDTTIIVWGSDLQELIEKASLAASQILQYMRSNKLAANPEKTKFIIFGGGKQEEVSIGELVIALVIAPSSCVTLLGLKLNRHLRWVDHVEEMECELSKRIGVLHRLRQFIPQNTLVSVMNVFFLSQKKHIFWIF